MPTRAEVEPQLILVVSDLHLGEGRDPLTGRYSRQENFFAGPAFCDFLQHHDPMDNAPVLLVLAGDTFDFLRVTSFPKTVADFDRWSARLNDLKANVPTEKLRDIERKERNYGLKTNDYKSVWKLLEIERGHTAFFDGLRWWIQRGGSLLFLKGNHDLELHWPLVKDSIRHAICAGLSSVNLKDQILFSEDSFQIDNIYIEHGHRFDKVTAVPGGAVMPNGQELSYPLGSFVNRYVINHLEGIEPFLDNIKPVQRVIRGVVKRHPLKIFTIIRRSLPLLGRSFKGYWLLEAVLILFYFLALLLWVFTIGVIAMSLLSPSVAAKVKAIFGEFRQVLGVVGFFAPLIPGLLRDAVAAIRRLLRPKPRFEDAFAEGVFAALKNQPPGPFVKLFGVLGHTHHPDLQQLPSINDVPAYYLNSGTWAPLWDESRPDLIGRTIYTYLRFTRNGNGYDGVCREWRDTHRQEGDAVILRPPN